ncbi:MAG: arginine deiminase family protein [Streptococcus orisratti]|uniref:dimethylarginine dimethylaminohydrolase family protein n=1 Tax=Streptococcus orisratti TaxID=114652 RepID=UPI002A90A350|nr:arginine deiminase family protein [Streptococcus orisratti]MDY5635509.1 arginine deiminase family protein [Streptococcus orisratti]
MTVIDGTSRLRKVLLCKPEFLVSAAPINVISEHYTKPLNRDKMMQEFESVVKAYEENEVEVIQVTSSENMPNAVFTRDFGGNVKEGYILGRFKKEIRFEERNHYEMIMSELGISKIAEVDDGYFEGGDFAFIDEKTLAIGVIDRTNLTGVDEIRKQLEPYGYKVYAVKANPDYLHLDMCFNLVSPNLAIAYEAGLPDDFLDLLKEKGIKVISGTEEMIFKHGYNVEALGDNRVISLRQNAFINDALRKEGMEVIEVDISELLKAGGGVHCMTFPLERY